MTRARLHGSDTGWRPRFEVILRQRRLSAVIGQNEGLPTGARVERYDVSSLNSNTMPSTNEFPGFKARRRFAGHWVCFSCRKMFHNAAPKCVCPQCAQPMIEMGTYFEPPKRSDQRMWDTLKALAGDGYRFHTEGSRAFFYGPGSDGRTPSARAVVLRMRRHLGFE